MLPVTQEGACLGAPTLYWSGSSISRTVQVIGAHPQGHVHAACGRSLGSWGGDLPGEGLACRALALTARESDLRALTALPMLSFIVTTASVLVEQGQSLGQRRQLLHVHAYSAAGGTSFRTSSAVSHQSSDCLLAARLYVTTHVSGTHFWEEAGPWQGRLGVPILFILQMEGRQIQANLHADVGRVSSVSMPHHLT